MQTRAVLLCLFGLTSCLHAESLQTQKVFGRYQQRSWNEQNGLPQNTVSAITRTRDGYLWAGTIEGLVRFDGVRFTVFDTANTPALKNNTVLALLEDGAGTLWIGTDGGGLTSLTNGRFIAYGKTEGLADLRVTCLFEDRAGHLWAGTEGGGLHVFRDGKLQVVWANQSGTSPRISALAQDAGGNLWVGTDAGLLRFAEGVCTNHLAQVRIRSLFAKKNGDLWIGTDGSGLQRFTQGQFRSDNLDTRLRQGRVWAINEDATGALWFGLHGGGLLRLTSDGQLSSFASQDGLTSDLVTTIYRDPEGSVWVGSEVGGLSQFAQGRFTTYSAEDGLANEVAKGVFEDATGAIWAGTEGGVSRWQNGKFSNAGADLAECSVRSIAQDRAGVMWFATTMRGGEARIYRSEGAGFMPDILNEKFPGTRVTVLLGDRAGGLWMGTFHGALCYRAANGDFTTLRKESGSLDDFVTAIYEDREGAIWIGTAGRGMSRLKDGNFTSWTTENGLTSNHVLGFHQDRNGALWIGTHGGGLQRFKDGKFATITRRDGLYDDLAFVILEDDAGDFWISCNMGIYRASGQQLNDFADGKISAVASFAYGTEDGMLSRECSGARPSGTKARDGRLWFPTIKGVVVVDPAQRSTQPPEMAIERVRIDGTDADLKSPARIHPPNETIEIDYTALSWQRPQQIRFRYRLAGLDRQWTDAGTRRTAYFSHLPPGSYTFEVVADNGEGVWATKAARVALVVLPPFWRTWWFLSLCAFVLLAMIVAGFRWRDAQLKRRVAAQEEFSRRLMDAHESERRRIAAELHDGLGQTLAMIKNRALANNDAEITEQSAGAIAEMREIAHNLRPYLLDRLGLTKALRSMFEKVAENSELRLRAEVEEIDGRFPPTEEISLYRVLQESLNNVLKHSEATEADVTIRARQDSVRITIHDNGRGFDSQKLSLGKTGTGGFGLIGMAERVRLLGGTHDIVSAPGQGTTVTIDLPSIGYARNGETPPHSLS